MSNANVKSDLFEQFARIGKALSRAKRLAMLDFLAQAERSAEALACRSIVAERAGRIAQHFP